VRSSVSKRASVVKLGGLDVPKFSGDFKQWSTFKDIFTALIHSNDDISEIEKSFYLKAALFGSSNRTKPQEKII